jgi:Tol biopolymer transport system component
VLHVAAYQAPPRLVRSQLVWFDRSGKRLESLGSIADYGNIELSPDGKRVAVAMLDSASGTHDLWMLDTADGQRTAFTSTSADENWLIWSHDGQRVVFNSQRNGHLDLYESAADAHAAEQVLLADADPKWPLSWSADGRHILYVINSQETGNDVRVLPLFGDRRPYPFQQTKAAENWAAFSPDGHWVSFSSSESGEVEVYVTAFPSAGRKWRVSAGGGSQARWRRDGSELFYVALDGKLMSVSVKAQRSDFEVGAVRPLFEVRFPYAQYHAYDVSADGQRFLVNTVVLPRGTPLRAAH